MLQSHKKTIFETLGRHPIHPFPARMAPGIALDALGASNAPLRVLDPMVGSGTVLAVAHSNGHHSIGVDLDPLAVLLAGVWTQSVDSDEVNDKAAEVLDRARSVFNSVSPASAYPDHTDEKTRSFIRFWFDDNARQQLASLSTAIRRVRAKEVRDVLWCGFSRLIITKSAGASLAMDLSHSRPHKKYEVAPIEPFSRFLSAVETVVSNCPQYLSESDRPMSVAKLGDARQLDVESASIDLVLTSPPYLNAIDYMRCSKFSLVWMGYNIDQLRQIRGESIGAESASSRASETPWVKSAIKELGLSNKLSERDQGLLARYIYDMDQALCEVSRVLKFGGRAVYVVGDSTVRGVYVRNSEIVKSVAEKHGLVLSDRRSRELPANRRYMPPPKKRAGFATIEGRMRREVVLAFAKPPTRTIRSQ